MEADLEHVDMRPAIQNVQRVLSNFHGTRPDIRNLRIFKKFCLVFIEYLLMDDKTDWDIKLMKG